MDLALLACLLLVALGVWVPIRIFLLLRHRRRPSQTDWALLLGWMSVIAGTAIYIGSSRTLSVELRGQPKPTPQLSPAERLSEIFRHLALASIAFNAPQEMNLDETTGIELLLSLTEPIERLQMQLKEAGKPQGARIRAATQMEATLRPARKDVFEVVPVFPDKQTLRPDVPTRWAWKVTPLEGGRQELLLAVGAPIESWAPMTMTTYTHSIAVNVTPWKHVTRFGKNNWQWLWTALLIPAAGVVWRRWRRKRSEVPE